MDKIQDTENTKSFSLIRPDKSVAMVVEGTDEIIKSVNRRLANTGYVYIETPRPKD